MPYSPDTHKANSTHEPSGSLFRDVVVDEIDDDVTDDTTNANVTVEQARVIAVETDPVSGQGALWVEVFQVSTCGKCEARSSCGQGVLSRWFGRGSHCLRVLYDNGQADLYSVGQWVEIGVPDGVVLKASFITYMVPIIGLITGAALFDQGQSNDLMALIGGVVGLSCGFFLSHWYDQKHFNCERSQPRLLGLSSRD